MRCYSCNCVLTPQEARAKFLQSNTYTEMCNGCLNTIPETEVVQEEVEHDGVDELTFDEVYEEEIWQEVEEQDA